MQVVAVRKGENLESDRLIDGAHVLRALVFQERLGWNVTVRCGRERDAYDELKPTYLVATDESHDRVMGCVRLLPATGPIMLRETFPTLLDAACIPHSPDVVESSRFCVDTRCRGAPSLSGLHDTTLALLEGLLEWAIANGHSRIVTATDLRFERLLGRAGLPFHRFGAPRQIGQTAAVAGMVVASAANIGRVRSAVRRAPGTKRILLAA
jgi:acyl homoserine lactone synthase